MRLAGYAVLVLTTFVWGTSFVAIRTLLTELRPLPIMTLRFYIGAAGYLALLILLHRGLPRLPRRMIGRLLVVGVAGSALNTIAVNYAVDLLGAGISSLVIMLVPVFTGLLALLAGQERLQVQKIQGFLVALTGLAVVVLLGGPGASIDATRFLSLLVMAFGALGFAVYNVFSKPLFATYSPIEVSAYVGIAACLGLVPFLVNPVTWPEFAALRDLSPGGWLLGLYLGLISNVVAYLGWYWSLKRLEATRVAIFTYLIPVWGLGSAALLLGERVTLWLPVGVALVVTGIIVANRRAVATPRPAVRS